MPDATTRLAAHREAEGVGAGREGAVKGAVAIVMFSHEGTVAGAAGRDPARLERNRVVLVRERAADDEDVARRVGIEAVAAGAAGRGDLAKFTSEKTARST